MLPGVKRSIYLFIPLTFLSSCSPVGDKVDASKSSSYYYQPFTGKIIYAPGGNWFERSYEKLDADESTFAPLSESVGKDRHFVFYMQHRQGHIHAPTFNVEDGVMKDHRFVYTVSAADKLESIQGADPATFFYLAPSSTNVRVWAKDKSKYYMYDRPVKVDYPSFTIVNENIFQDRDSIYIEYFKGILGVGVDNDVLIRINDMYARSISNLYFIGYPGGLRKLSFGRIRNVSILAEDMLNINDSIVYKGMMFPVAGMDPKTFVVVHPLVHYYKDRYQVYFEDKLLSGADVATFEMVFGYDEIPDYARDKSHVYWYGRVVEKADPDKFRYDHKSMVWTDGTYVFHGPELTGTYH